MADQNGNDDKRDGRGGKREGAGRPKTAVDLRPRERYAEKPSATQKNEFAAHAMSYAYEVLDHLLDIVRHSDNDSARVSAGCKILDRAMGKAPLHIDFTALHHTEIVYRSVDEIRKALIERGVPPVLLAPDDDVTDVTPTDEKPTV